MHMPQTDRVAPDACRWPLKTLWRPRTPALLELLKHYDDPSIMVLRFAEGGNHAQFGDYGEQPGDTAKPTMSAQDQRAAAVAVTVEVLRGE